MTDPSASRPARPSRLRAAALLLTGGAVGAAAVWAAGFFDRTPPDPHDAPAFRAPTGGAKSHPRSSGTVRVVTWNVHQFEGVGGAASFARAGALLGETGFDLAVLQEVTAAGPTGDPAADLAEATGAAAAFVGTERWFGEAHVGNAVLSRLPTTFAHRVPLPDSRGKGFRTAVLTTAALPGGGDVRVLNVHLSRGRDRAEQLARAVDLFLALKEPCVLAGDLNSRPDDPLLEPLRTAPGVVDALADAGVRASTVDGIFVRGLAVTDAALVPTDASDHPLYWADLTVAPAGRSGGTAATNPAVPDGPTDRP